MSLNRRLILSLILVAVVSFAVNCNAKKPTAQTLRLSMIPTTDPSKMLRESEPLTAYLEDKTGMKIDMTIPTNYAAVVEAIANDQVDIAYLGGFTYVQSSKRSGVIPLVQRDQDQNFHSVFITRQDSGINGLSDLNGHTFAFGDVNSTSGHLMPEYFMREAKVDPKVIEKATYTGGHDATALAVANNRVDAGAMDETVYQKMVSDGKLDQTKARVFYTTPPFFDYVWVARKGLDPKIQEAFANAFLKLDQNDPIHKPVLDVMRAKKYVRANDADYSKLRQAATDAGLLK
jgi:phosphonate transport system substrate-binding protein